MIGIVSVVVAIVLAIVLGWATSRAWRLRNVPLRMLTGVVSGLLTLVLAVVSIVGLAGVYRLFAPHGGPPAAITASATPDRLAVAARRSTGCAGCHSSTGDLPMDGGTMNFLLDWEHWLRRTSRQAGHSKTGRMARSCALSARASIATGTR